MGNKINIKIDNLNPGPNVYQPKLNFTNKG